jgi:hypothetical protein
VLSLAQYLRHSPEFVDFGVFKEIEACSTDSVTITLMCIPYRSFGPSGTEEGKYDKQM